MGGHTESFDMQTESTLISSKVVALTTTLFNTRWRGERECTAAQVIAAHRSLDLLDKPWPTKDTANREVVAIQRELDIITI